MAALTRVESWSKEEVDVLVAQTRADAKNPKIHVQFDLYVSLLLIPIPRTIDQAFHSNNPGLVMLCMVRSQSNKGYSDSLRNGLNPFVNDKCSRPILMPFWAFPFFFVLSVTGKRLFLLAFSSPPSRLILALMRFLGNIYE